MSAVYHTFCLIVFMFSAIVPLFGQGEQTPYRVLLDLNAPENDQLQVIINTPPVDKDQIEFQIPKMVPGTYSIYDFGRFINRFEAFNLDGEKMVVDSLTPNRRRINDASTLAEIRYWVEDSYDTDKPNFIFEPAGTSIQADTAFVLNTYGFIGYLEGMKERAYEITIKRPAYMFGATALEKVVNDSLRDIYVAPGYFELADSPILYCRPDTATLNVGGAEILVSVYSPKKMLTADFVMSNVEEILNATKSYLGGTLPVDRYAFLIYLLDRTSGSGGYGALEHSYSSLYSLPEFNPAFLAQTIRDVAAHEFLHIITPLNIHAEQIGNFDFINPEMSIHLWLYEGVTEYFAGNIQVREGLMSVASYLSVLKGKIEDSKKYNDTLPFTELSRLALGEHEDQYQNVYQKGALIGMALDIKLLEWSDGKYNLEMLMDDLAEIYGKDKSFKDEALFDEIAAITDPSIKDFLDTYVAGSSPLPYADLFDIVGIEFSRPEMVKTISLGNVNFTLNPETERFVVANEIGMDAFGRAIGYQEGDEILSLNKQEVDFNNYLEIFEDFKANTEPGDKVKITVLRDKNGKLKKTKLKATAVEVENKTDFEISVMESATAQQRKLREAWLGK